MNKIYNLKNNKKYWQELVSMTESVDNKLSELDFVKVNDYQWLLKTKKDLSRIFIWDNFNKQTAKINLENRLQKNSKKVSFQITKIAWIRAAGILLVIISVAVAHSLIGRGEIKKVFTEITVPPGQMTHIKLPDGSLVWLNSGSIFKFSNDYNLSNREVSLDGEGFFEVSKNKEKPFTVTTSKFSIEVLGTTFNLTAYSGDVVANITLVEGLVQINSGNNKKMNKIIPGQSASIVNGDLNLVTKVNTEFYTSWKDGKIVFRRETLEEIARKLERWYNVEIKFTDDDLKELVYSGTLLKYKPVEQVFKSLVLLNKDVDFVSENRIDQKDIIYIKRREHKLEIMD